MHARKATCRRLFHDECLSEEQQYSGRVHLRLSHTAMSTGNSTWTLCPTPRTQHAWTCGWIGYSVHPPIRLPGRWQRQFIPIDRSCSLPFRDQSRFMLLVRSAASRTSASMNDRLPIQSVARSSRESGRRTSCSFGEFALARNVFVGDMKAHIVSCVLGSGLKFCV